MLTIEAMTKIRTMAGCDLKTARDVVYDLRAAGVVFQELGGSQQAPVVVHSHPELERHLDRIATTLEQERVEVNVESGVEIDPPQGVDSLVEEESVA